MRSWLVKRSLRMARLTSTWARPRPQCSLAVVADLFAVLAGRADFGQLGGEGEAALVVAAELVDFAGDVLEAALQDLVGDLLLVEDHDFLDGADAALEIVADGEDLADDDGRAGERLEDADLSALDALGDFDLALAGEQRDGAHLAQIHADGVVGLFQGAGGEVEFDVLGLLRVGIELFLGGKLGVFQDVDALGADHSEQVVEIVGGVDVVGQEVIHLVVGEEAFFLAGIDQLLNIFVFIVESQEQYPSLAP